MFLTPLFWGVGTKSLAKDFFLLRRVALQVPEDAIELHDTFEAEYVSLYLEEEVC